MFPAVPWSAFRCSPCGLDSTVVDAAEIHAQVSAALAAAAFGRLFHAMLDRRGVDCGMSLAPETPVRIAPLSG